MTPQQHAARAATIAAQNDGFRSASMLGLSLSGVSGMVVYTPGVSYQGAEFMTLLHLEVALFATFTEDNDPHGDHSFGVVKVMGQKVYWKIDYYDLALEYGSDDPADLAQTMRVMTLLLPSEY